MTAEELKEAIFEELNERDVNSSHDITKDSVEQLLVEPTVIELNAWGGQRKSYWLVLDEQPGDLEKGYQVVYDEGEDMFGLATKITVENKDTGYLVGLYGSFIDAVDNM